MAVVSSERRDELIAEINHRMKGSEENMRLLAALEIQKQPINALESWLRYLKRSRVTGRDDYDYEL